MLKQLQLWLKNTKVNTLHYNKTKSQVFEIILICLAFSFLFFDNKAIAGFPDVPPPFDQTPAFSKNAGKDSGQFVKDSATGSPNLLNEKLATPMQQSGTMTSLDNAAPNPLTDKYIPVSKKTGNAGANCTNAEQFLEVLYQPGTVATGGDINNLKVMVDTNLDGTADYLYTVAAGNIVQRVSGICANGIIECDAGSWSNCKYYIWSSNSVLNIELLNVPTIKSLGGCYCINNSCGFGLVLADRDVIARDIGAGIVGAIQKGAPNIMVSSSTSDIFQIKYNGQDFNKCSSNTVNNTPVNNQLSTNATSQPDYYQDQADVSKAVVGVKPGNQTQVAANAMKNSANTAMKNQSGLMHDDGVNRAAIESSDPKSASYGAKNALAQSRTGATVANCVMEYTPWVEPKGFIDNGTATASISTDHYPAINVIESPVGSQNYKVNLESWNVGGGYEGTPTIVKNVVKPNPDSVTVSLFAKATMIFSNAGVPVSGGCNAGTNSVSAAVFSPTFSVATVLGNCPAGGTQTPYFTVEWDIAYEYDLLHDDPPTDTCATYANNSTCKLKEESVCEWSDVSASLYCITTVNNYNLMNLSFVNPTSSKTIVGTHKNFIVPHAWWKKERTYTCTSLTPIDFTDAEQRANLTANTITKDASGNLKYTDTIKDKAGNWVTQPPVTSAPPDVDTSPACEVVCKIKRVMTTTELAQVGAKSDNLIRSPSISTAYGTATDTPPETYDSYFKKCDSGGSCPIDALKGEILAKACACQDGFAEAVATMQSMSEVAADTICSDGSKTTPPPATGTTMTFPTLP